MSLSPVIAVMSMATSSTIDGRPTVAAALARTSPTGPPWRDRHAETMLAKSSTSSSRAVSEGQRAKSVR